MYSFTDRAIFLMAAAYTYHIAENQSFIDGNKRPAITTALVFLELNDIRTSTIADAELYDAMIAIAEKRLDKAGLAEIFRRQLKA
jgi:death on curing protein